jgi:hypothetical protein
MHRPGFFIAYATLLLGVGCAGPPSARSDGSPVFGVWNGLHASLTLADTGGTIEYDCAHGRIRAALQPDAAGRFDVPGVHFRDHGGPVRIGEVPDSVAARYVGQVRGGEMTLRVFVGSDTLGPFTLRRDATQQLMRCL